MEQAIRMHLFQRFRLRITIIVIRLWQVEIQWAITRVLVVRQAATNFRTCIRACLMKMTTSMEKFSLNRPLWWWHSPSYTWTTTMAMWRICYSINNFNSSKEGSSTISITMITVIAVMVGVTSPTTRPDAQALTTTWLEVHADSIHINNRRHQLSTAMESTILVRAKLEVGPTLSRVIVESTMALLQLQHIIPSNRLWQCLKRMTF